MVTAQEIVFFGILGGAITVIIALGFSLVAGILGIVNFAHGNQVMLAMYVALLLFNYTHADPTVGTVLVLPIMFLLGLGLYWLIVRHLIDKPQTVQVAATIGIMLILENVVNLLFGGSTVEIPTVYQASSVQLMSVYIPLGQLIAGVFAAVGTWIFYWVMHHTDFGLAVQSCAGSLLGAKAAGISTGRVYALAFAVSVAMAGLGGVAAAMYQPMTPFVGTNFLNGAFAVVVLGGLGNIRGTVLMGLLIGLIQAASQVIFSSSIGNALIFGLIMLVLLVRPEGVLATQ